ncbi:A24 family peptidase [Lancefieldella sp. Marseille-Q7238]|uniref:prepilin peptidase n=1 Tax=Lancefieldella sp. Marseille-Q7238 TaxID=3022127 RepID=UPI0024AA000F|nr:A24 family peptidase [Lancefieldella sp. Marseille-Q7238]
MRGDALTRPSPLAVALVLIVIAIASVIDVKTRKVPNQIPLCIAVIGILDAVAGSHPEGNAAGERAMWFLVSLFYTLTVLLVTSRIARFICGRAGIGGGDIKLLSALAGIFGVESMMLVMFIACVTSVMFLYGWRIAHLKRKQKEAQSSQKSSSFLIYNATFPFVPFIATGVIVCLKLANYL